LNFTLCSGQAPEGNSGIKGPFPCCDKEMHSWRHRPEQITFEIHIFSKITKRRLLRLTAQVLTGLFQQRLRLNGRRLRDDSTAAGAARQIATH